MILLHYGVILSSVCWCIVLGDGGGDWGYGIDSHGDNMVDKWKSLVGSQCGGSRQSPININTKQATYSALLKPVKISQARNESIVILEKTKASLVLRFSDQWNMSFDDDGCYRPVGLHWHWGSVDTKGSEHTIDDVQYPIEGHLVTFNCKLYRNFSESLQYPDGLFVFGMLYKISKIANSALDKVLANIDNINKNGKANITEIPPEEFLPKNLSSYFQYSGSLTTPPCSEIVVWTVFNEIQNVAVDQLSKFRSLQFGSPLKGAMVDNFRPVQLNKMSVQSSFYIPSAGTQYSFSPLLIFIIAIYLLL